MTDGWATDLVLAKIEVRKLKKAGVHMLAVGIGDQVDKTGLKTMVNSSDEVVFVETWKGLMAKVPDLRKKSCNEIQKIKRTFRALHPGLPGVFRHSVKLPQDTSLRERVEKSC
jgi:hypothetical protein